MPSVTTGTANSAFGAYSLFSNITGNFNTAVGVSALYLNTADSNTALGAAALLLNTGGTENTATGAGALLSNTTGIGNTASGAFALSVNTTGSGNTANGLDALEHNSTGGFNTATGSSALLSNTTGSDNTANGALALEFNSGSENTAMGSGALVLNTVGNNNTATGFQALFNNTANGNTAVGSLALLNNIAGSGNTAVGDQAASFATAGNNTVVGVFAGGTSTGITGGINNTVVGANAGEHIGAGIDNLYLGANVDPGVTETGTIRINDSFLPVSGTTSLCFIDGIFGKTVGGTNVPVIMNANGQLGTTASSARYKKDINSMGKTSEAIYSLKPVTFHYKGDETNTPCFGLIAEDVAMVNADLIIKDEEGEPMTVRYEQINAMLLNEFLKEHRTVQKLKSIVAKQEAIVIQQQKQIEALTGGLQRVSAQLEASKPAPQVAAASND